MYDTWPQPNIGKSGKRRNSLAVFGHVPNDKRRLKSLARSCKWRDKSVLFAALGHEARGIGLALFTYKLGELGSPKPHRASGLSEEANTRFARK
jgi:hypothetical protein